MTHTLIQQDQYNSDLYHITTIDTHDAEEWEGWELEELLLSSKEQGHDYDVINSQSMEVEKEEGSIIMSEDHLIAEVIEYATIELGEFIKIS